MKLTAENVIRETLVAAMDAHSVAGAMMEGLFKPKALEEAALQMERAARYIRRISAEKQKGS